MFGHLASPPKSPGVTTPAKVYFPTNQPQVLHTPTAKCTDKPCLMQARSLAERSINIGFENEVWHKSAAGVTYIHSYMC